MVQGTGGSTCQIYQVAVDGEDTETAVSAECLYVGPSKLDGKVGSAHLEEQLLPRQAVLSDLAVLPAQLLHASPLPVALVKNVQRPHLLAADAGGKSRPMTISVCFLASPSSTRKHWFAFIYVCQNQKQKCHV